MALLKHLVVSESYGGVHSTESEGTVTPKPSSPDKGESSSEAEDNTRAARHRRNRMEERTDLEHVDVGSPSPDAHGLGQRRKGQGLYRAMELPDVTGAGETGSLRHREDCHDSGSSNAGDNHKGRRIRRPRKQKEYVDPLEQKYLELNELLMKDFVEKRLSEHPNAYRKLSHLYKPCVPQTHKRPPQIPYSQRIMSEHILHNQLKGDRIRRKGDASSDTSSNDVEKKIINLSSLNVSRDSEGFTDSKPGVLRRRRPLSATLERKSRPEPQARGVGNAGRRSRSVGNAGRRRQVSPNKSNRSESLSCGRTATDSSTCTSPRRVTVPVDCHLKNTQNEEMRRWLENKNKLLRQERQQRRAKKHQERIEQMEKVTAMYERSVLCKKEIQEWRRRKQKEAWQKNQEEKVVKEIKNREAAQEKESLKANIKPLKSCLKSGSSLENLPSFRNVKASTDTNNPDNDGQHNDKFQLEEEEQARKAAELREKGPNAPNRAFMYKRPVTGKIRFKMPKAPKSESSARRTSNMTEDERREKARMSYDQWLVGKRKDEIKRKKMEDKKENVLRESDPMVHVLSEAGKRRVSAVFQKKKCIDTEMNEAGTASNNAGRPASVSSTCKSRPKPSSKSPRRVHRRLENVMENDSKLNPFVLPFPPEQGVPRHVAAKQREIFAEKVWKTKQEDSTPAGEIIKKEGQENGENVNSRTGRGNQDTGTDSTEVPEQFSDGGDSDEGNLSPRYGFNRRSSPLTTSSSDQEATAADGGDSSKTSSGKTKAQNDDTDILNTDGVFLTSLQTY
ncbi:trichohyalin-like [Liolophura sinensis]|uniref:trichohyalin-like n=1 Tax=Liolophura sinensis TaxID=3198878 RepID=UPI003157FB17